MPPVTQACECSTIDCCLQIDMPFEKAGGRVKQGLILIVDGCPYGPSRDDIFREQGDGYRLFREG